jgi:cell division septation protein DedD
MTNLLRIHVGRVTVLAVLLGFSPGAFAQTSVVVEVRVLELSRTDLEAMGGTAAKPGFAKSLTKSLTDSLMDGPRSRIVHRIELPATSENATQVRLDSRIAVTSSSSADVQTFFDAGIVMDVTPKVFQNRDISLATASQVRIRRGPDAVGTSLVVFENPSLRFDTRIHEGESIVLGGFITAAERMTLPDMPMLPDNPILNYLYPKARNPQDRTEIAILLTPRIVGTLINPAVDAPVIVSKPAVVNPSSPSLTPPLASPSAAATSPTVSTPQSAITGALPAASATAMGNSPPVVTSPTVVASAPTASSTTAEAVKPPVVTSPTVVASTPTASSTTAEAVKAPVVTSPTVVASTPTASTTTASAVKAPVVTSRPEVASTPTATSTTAAVKVPVVSSPPVVAGPPWASSTTAAAVKSAVGTPPPVSTLPAVAPPAELEGTGGKYTVQVGAFDQLEKAEALRSQLAKKYDMVFVEKVGTSKTPYRVRVGRFAEMPAARQLEQKLIADGIDTYVTTLN